MPWKLKVILGLRKHEFGMEINTLCGWERKIIKELKT